MVTDEPIHKLSARPEDVARKFLVPRPPAQRRLLELDGGRMERITTPEGPVAIHRAGSGPAVLLMHGWEGQASDMSEFAQPLMNLDHSVVFMDLPAHGESTGTQSSIPHSARALSAVVAAIGPLHAAIAHSMGSPILAEALYNGLPVARIVLIAPPAHFERYVRGAAAAAGLDAEGTNATLEKVTAAIGVDVRDLSLPRRATHLRQPALLIHSSDDRIIAIEDSLAIVAAWPGALHMRVEGLGHQRILADPTVVAAAVEFATAM